MSVDPTFDEPTARRPGAWLRAALAVSALRLVLPLAALPLIPALLPDDVPLLILLRPGRELLLVGGGLSRIAGDPGIAAMFLAYLVPMTIGVWSFFVLGRAYGPSLRAGTGPGWLQRSLPHDRMAIASRLLTRRGPTIAVVGRVASVPPMLLAAAAGASDVDARRYLLADLVGMVLTFAAVVAIGYGLGGAYERGGPWLTGAGLVLVLGLGVGIAHWVRREAARDD